MKSLRLALALLLTVPTVSHGFVLTMISASAYQRWELVNLNLSVPTNSLNRTTRAVRYYLASDGYSATNTAAELNALRASFGQWLSITNTHLKFEEVGLVPGPINSVNTSDGSNILFWAKSSTSVGGGNNISGALGVAFISFFSSGALSQGDIVFNGVEETWFTDINDVNNPGFFVEGVALHEIGHFLGLRHSPLGGATMLYVGGDGISLQIGLSQDEVAAARFLYPTNTSLFGTVSGTITRNNGGNVFGAAVYLQDSTTNIVQGTVSQTNGTYLFKSILPGTYSVRVAPLDATGVADFLASGNQIGNPSFSGADPFFLPTTTTTTSVVANITNTINFTVTSNAPAFRITKIRSPSSSSGNYSWSSVPVRMTVGQSNYFIGVASANIPSNNAALTITGNGLTVGTTTFLTNAFGSGLNFASVPISVSSNATPGLRSFIITQGANVAYANGYLEIAPAAPDDNFDGLSDLFQRQYFPVFTTNIAAPNADPDGDNFNNYSEFIAGTVPTNSASFLTIQSITRNVSGATVVWQSVAGKRYQVSALTNIASAAWGNIGSVVTAAGATAQYTDSSATNNAFKFYRVQALP